LRRATPFAAPGWRTAIGRGEFAPADDRMIFVLIVTET
jgi:hypothetical protein